MTYNISAFGSSAFLMADKTLPLGYNIDAFADDNDAIRFDPTTINNCKVDLNGKMYSSSEPSVIVVSISVIPNSKDDATLRNLLNAGHASAYQNFTPDILTLTLKYPGLSVVVLRDGRLISGPMGLGVQATGRFATNTFVMHFADITTINPSAAFGVALGAAAQFAGF